MEGCVQRFIHDRSGYDIAICVMRTGEVEFTNIYVVECDAAVWLVARYDLCDLCVGFASLGRERGHLVMFKGSTLCPLGEKQVCILLTCYRQC